MGIWEQYKKCRGALKVENVLSTHFLNCTATLHFFSIDILMKSPKEIKQQTIRNKLAKARKMRKPPGSLGLKKFGPGKILVKKFGLKILAYLHSCILSY